MHVTQGNSSLLLYIQLDESTKLVKIPTPQSTSAKPKACFKFEPIPSFQIHQVLLLR